MTTKSLWQTMADAQKGNSLSQNLLGIEKVEGIAGHNDEFTLDKDKIVQKVTMQFGPMAKRGGEMLVYALVGNKQWRPVAVISADIVEKFDIRPGDWISAPTMGEKEVRVTNSRSGGSIKLPTVSDSLGLFGKMGLGSWEFLINGEAPHPGDRIDWRDQPQEDVYYPQGSYDLGNDPELSSIQLLQMIGYLGRGSKNVIAAEAGGGKTTLLLGIIEGVLTSNPETNLHFVVVIYHERAEDAGDYIREVRDCFERHQRTNVKVEFIIADTDDAMDLYKSMKVAQLATARAERLAEHYAQKSNGDQADVVLVFDSGVRLARTADMLKPGGDFGTLSGGRDPFSILIIQAIVQAGRSQMIVDRTGNSKRVNLTTIVTLLIEPGSSGDRQIADWAGDITGLIVLRPKANNATILPGGLIAWEACLFRQPQDAVDLVTLSAQQKLITGLRQEQNGKRNTVDTDSRLVGWLYTDMKHRKMIPNNETGGRAKAALKLQVPDLALPLEREHAIALIEDGSVANNEIGSVEQLIDLLVLPVSWGEKIWNRLAEEGIVWPLDYLKAKELYLSGTLHGEGLIPKPADFTHQLRMTGLGPQRAQEIWQMLIEELGEDQVSSLYDIAYYLIEAGNQPRETQELATLMGITKDWAQPIWEWLLDGLYAPPPIEIDEVLDAIDPQNTGRAHKAKPEPVTVVAVDPAIAAILQTEDGRKSYVNNRKAEWAKEHQKAKAEGNESGVADFITGKFLELGIEIDFNEAKRLGRLLFDSSGSKRRR
ncbi:hypothetical protein COX05_02600 [candidate division WWE3 bacterium CG22_combo_CG10-13_8_21_14_all_39_12]|uniref:Uncharacterized protein n=1 Tax=candidate division WWE3 bacterium CG22_combo_CG10-13_8_21_14_all_39_12 TaxID=1975094 RepID=A0A2H0BFX4_UNCKA|nr:MAG: hypothetical protein COX05_02600 [candidate division WWE3 bacterium CG22_combo_CG10-13_8_21_14_all_39_12]